MKKTTFIFIVFFGFLGCTSDRSKIEMLIKEKIKGNWKTEYFKGNWKKTAFVFTFQDSTCSYMFPFGEYSKYWIDGDTLIIKERIYKDEYKAWGGKINYKFLVDSISSEQLILKPITNETKKLFDCYEEHQFDKIKLAKITNQFNWKIKRIGFYSTGCFGTCPEMYLEIDSVGNLFFHGMDYTEKEGFYFGKLSVKEFEVLKTNINCLELDNLKKMYAASWTDDQTCGVCIRTIDTTYEGSAYGFDKEPIELRIVFHWLMELYKNIELKKDTTIKEKFEFKEFQLNMRPTPPPALIEKRK